MTDGEKAIVDELSSLRLEVVQLHQRVAQVDRSATIMLVFLLIIGGLVAAIALGWVEVAIKVKDASF
ncbi:MAG: hypothetical protein JNK12_21270 [Acidimicrobiales bacterium]|nr:hypothetical protein [Acidimicrobiales bacterium]